MKISDFYLSFFVLMTKINLFSSTKF